MTVPATPALHLPDEPVDRAERWLAALHRGSSLDEVLTGPGGVTSWLWTRWSSLASAGVGEDQLASIVRGYGRELWFWLAGERTWAQACSGLIGRIGRRLPQGDATGV